MISSHKDKEVNDKFIKWLEKKYSLFKSKSKNEENYTIT